MEADSVDFTHDNIFLKNLGVGIILNGGGTVDPSSK